MKKQAGTTTKTCMTPEEAKGPKGDIFAGNRSGNCKSEGFSWSGGRIKGKTTCAGQGGAGKTVMDDGRQLQRPEHRHDDEVEDRPDGKAMTMEMRVSGRASASAAPRPRKAEL